MKSPPFTFLAAALVTALFQAPDLNGAQEERHPNIILILVDDQGYYDLGCYGATEVKTPHIDKMAAEGVRFTNYYAAAPICSPSRAGLLTGCYPKRIGLATWVQRADSKRGIHTDELTLAELLKANGYATACIGKWHLGFKKPFLPRAQGFDHYYGLLHNLDPVEVIHFGEKGVPLIRNGEVVKRPAAPAELTKAYTDEALAWMEKQKGAPFFLYLPHTMLHNPLGVGEDFIGTSDWGKYGDAIQELDHHVGRLFTFLEKHGLSKNTVVIYASDNGRGPGRNADQRLRGRKLSTYEAGIRVPCIAWGPGRGIRPDVVSNQVTSALDWFPTLATFADAKVPTDRVIDGRDIFPNLTGDEAPTLNIEAHLNRNWDPAEEWKSLFTRQEYADAFFIHGSHGALAAVRWDKWKLVLNPTLQLYDLESDPGESKPVRNAAISRKLRGMAVTFQEEMADDARPAGKLPKSGDAPTP